MACRAPAGHNRPMRKRAAQSALILAVLLALPGCGPLRYAAARARDLADIFQVNAGFSMGLATQIKATDLLHLHQGISMDKKFGFVGRHGGTWEEYTSGLLPLLPAYACLDPNSPHPFPLPDPGADEYINTRTCTLGGPGITGAVQDWCNVVHLPGLGMPRRRWVDRFDLELGATALVVNARAGVSPGQAIDFLVGWLGLDPAHDDRPAVRPTTRAR